MRKRRTNPLDLAPEKLEKIVNCEDNSDFAKLVRREWNGAYSTIKPTSVYGTYLREKENQEMIGCVIFCQNFDYSKVKGKLYGTKTGNSELMSGEDDLSGSEKTNQLVKEIIRKRLERNLPIEYTAPIKMLFHDDVAECISLAEKSHEAVKRNTTSYKGKIA